MPFNAQILDPSIVSQGVRESKIDLATPVNMYNSIRADQRAQKLSELTLSKEEREQKKAADLDAIIKGSLTPDGHIDSQKAIVALNRGGFVDEAAHIQDRYNQAATENQAKQLATAKDMSTSFLTAADSKNPVSAFMMAREEGKTKGWPMSPGILQYNPSDQEIATGKFADPRVQQELIYHGERFLTPEERIARAKQSADGKGAKYGFTPIYGKDATGNTVAFQSSDAGGARQIELPPGITLTPGVQMHDLGDSVGIFDKSGNAVATVKKGVDPGKTADLGLKGEELKLKQAEDARKAKEFQDKQLEVAKKTRAFDAKNKDAMESLQTFLDKAHAVKDNPNMKYVTGAGKVGQYIPGTGAADLQSDINFLVASGAIETLAKMKAQSATGASGMGALSDSEMILLKNAFSSLGNNNISPNKKRDELGRVIKVIDRRLREQRELSRGSSSLLGPETPEPTEGEKLDAGIDGLGKD